MPAPSRCSQPLNGRAERTALHPLGAQRDLNLGERAQELVLARGARQHLGGGEKLDFWGFSGAEVGIQTGKEPGKTTQKSVQIS